MKYWCYRCGYVPPSEVSTGHPDSALSGILKHDVDGCYCVVEER